MPAAEQPLPTEFAVVHFTLLVSFHTVSGMISFPLPREQQECGQLSNLVANSQELNANTKKNEPPKSNVLKNFEAGFASKLAPMNDLFKKQGADGMKHRLSAVAPKPKFGLNKPATTTTNPSSSNNLGIINEEPDKMKEGYDPAANLQQTLEHVVIQKNKKKKKRPTDF